MGCATGLIKYLVFIFNLFFFLTGVAFLTLGIIYAMDYGDKVDLPDEGGYFKIAPIGALVIGAFVLVISFFGCCGAIKESSCMLNTYACILLALILAQIGIGVFALIEIQNEDDLKALIEKEINKLFSRYESNDAAKEAFDSMQTALECCGKNGFTDWTVAGDLPDSCCKDNNSDCSTNSGKDLYDEGCNSALFTFLKDSLNIIGIVLLALGVIEVLAGVFAITLSMSIRRQSSRNGY